MSHNYDVGTRVWQPDASEGWVASEVVKKSVDGDKVTLEFKLENEEVSQFRPSRSRAKRLLLAIYPFCDEGPPLPSRMLT